MEAILFASGEPLGVDRICMALGLDRETAETLLRRLEDHYAYERRGVRLTRMDDTYQLCSAPDYADVVRKAFEIRKSAKLSPPALEALTIVAYYQPTTRAYVDQVRGVDSSYTMSLLLERGLIEECGRLQVPGRPHQYRTTKEFLRVFHLSSLDELPEMPGLEQEGQMRIGEAAEVESADGQSADGQSADDEAAGGPAEQVGDLPAPTDNPVPAADAPEEAGEVTE